MRALGDERNCVQCLSEQRGVDDLEKENRRLSKTVEEQRAEIQRLQAALQ
jgi:predicted RNase H-like nuclease (RuvC/YqgF family)